MLIVVVRALASSGSTSWPPRRSDRAIRRTPAGLSPPDRRGSGSAPARPAPPSGRIAQKLGGLGANEGRIALEIGQELGEPLAEFPGFPLDGLKRLEGRPADRLVPILRRGAERLQGILGFDAERPSLAAAARRTWASESVVARHRARTTVGVSIPVCSQPGILIRTSGSGSSRSTRTWWTSSEVHWPNRLNRHHHLGADERMLIFAAWGGSRP